MKKLLLTIISALFITSFGMADPAPSFTLPDTEGKEHSLSDYKGKYVVLEWLNHQCPFVKKHYNSDNMQKLQKTYTAKGVIWLSICSSAPGKQGFFKPEEAHKLTEMKKASPTAVLLDPDGKTGHTYNAKRTPEIFIIGKEGEIIYHGAIDDSPRIKPANTDTAKNYVREVLDAVLKGDPPPITKTKPYGCSIKYAKKDKK